MGILENSIRFYTTPKVLQHLQRHGKSFILAAISLLLAVVTVMPMTAHAATTVINEQFTSSAANFTTVAGGTWTVTGGKYALTNPAYPTDSGLYAHANYAVHKTSVAGDFTASSDITLAGTGKGPFDAAVIFGWTDSNNYYYAGLNTATSAPKKVAGLYRVSNGSHTRLQTFNPTTYAPGVLRTITVTRSGNTITTTVGGTTVGTIVVSGLPAAGRLGVATRNDLMTVDNFNVTTPGDTTAPTVPSNLRTTSVAGTSVNLAWNAATDDTAVTGYQIYRDNVQIGTSTGTTYQSTGLRGNTNYSYAVVAVDAAGNSSPKSTALTVKTDYEKPNATNTGVPAGTVLTVHNGNMVITEPGTYDSLDIRGYVEIKAPNVKFTRTIFRGGPAATRGIALVTNYPTYATNLVIEDSEFVPTNPTYWVDAIAGANFTLRRVNMHGTVDGAHIVAQPPTYAGNVLVESSYLHDFTYYKPSPTNGDGQTHNDAVQMLGGSNVRIVGNTLLGAHNAAIQVNDGSATNIVIDRNWVDGGACTVNIATNNFPNISRTTVTNNKFGRNPLHLNCSIIASLTTVYSQSGNVYENNGAPIVPRRSDKD